MYALESGTVRVCEVARPNLTKDTAAREGKPSGEFWRCRGKIAGERVVTFRKAHASTTTQTRKQIMGTTRPERWGEASKNREALLSR